MDRSPSDSSPDDGDCPLCSAAGVDRASEAPPEFLAPRAFCSAHGLTAVLADGRRYADVTRSGDPCLDGPGTNYLLNPVTVGGVRGWATWVAGGFRVYEEIFSSEDYFEFTVQHDRSSLEILHRLHLGRAQFEGGVTHPALFSFLASLGDPALGARLQQLSLQARLREAFHASVSPDRSIEGAEALSKRMIAAVASPSAASTFTAFEALLALAARRFAHLPPP